MRKTSDSQKFDELALQLEDFAKDENGRESVDVEVAREVIPKLFTLRNATRVARTGPDHLREIDQALELGPDEAVRKAAFDAQIATIEAAVGGCKDNSSLRDASIFLRSIVIGLENFAIALDRQR